MLVAFAAALSASTAGADSISSARDQAAAAQRELNTLYAKEDVAVNAYDAARSKLSDVNRRIRLNTIRLHVAQRNLKAARSQLAGLVIAAYKGDNSSAAMYVLGATSFMGLVNRVDVINRSNESESKLLHQVTVSEHQVLAKRVELRGERVQARRYVGRTRSAKEKVQGLVSSQKALIQSLNAKVRNLIAQRKAHLAAEARARAAAAAKAAANPPPVAPIGTVPTPPSGGPVPPANSLGEQAVQIAMGELGVPYVWGGASPAGFDCSGLTMWVYAQLGIHLDHYTGAQWDEGVPVARNELEPGDLVFFEPDIGHVGLYIGGNDFIEAPHTGGVVQISSLLNPWYAEEYDGARRVTG
jgi:cell wall-associated NlpC family hydrolase